MVSNVYCCKTRARKCIVTNTADIINNLKANLACINGATILIRKMGSTPSACAQSKNKGNTC
jgi:hypothetical protein